MRIRELGRWTVGDDAARAIERPDGRVFLIHRIASDDSFVPLLEQALDDFAGPIHLTVNSDAADRRHTCEKLGLHPVLTSLRYHVPFERALDLLPAKRIERLEIKTATDVDPDRLFGLDTQLRGDVPGTDGWVGVREAFDDELVSPEFDENGYLVGVDPRDSSLVGLCRMWRNEDGPLLGMLGVVAHRRSGYVAAALLAETLTRSSEWGWPTFETHTARPRLQRHLARAGATSAGGFVTFLRPG